MKDRMNKTPEQKPYYLFVSYREQFDIIFQYGRSAKDVINDFRNLGYKVTLALSKEVYEGYQNVDPNVFFDAYPAKFNEYREELIRKIMFGEG